MYLRAFLRLFSAFGTFGRTHMYWVFLGSLVTETRSPCFFRGFRPADGRLLQEPAAGDHELHAVLVLHVPVHGAHGPGGERDLALPRPLLPLAVRAAP